MTDTHCPDCHTEIHLTATLTPGEEHRFYCGVCEKAVYIRAEGQTAGTGPRVLVVEDTTAVRTVLAEMLRGAGYVVETAGDGEESLELLDTFQTELILLDLFLPKVTGFEVLEALEARENAPPVLVISGSHEPDSIKRAHELGAQGFIPKSALRDTLLFRVENLLSEPAATGTAG